jgi:hypothetical protein
MMTIRGEASFLRDTRIANSFFKANQIVPVEFVVRFFGKTEPGGNWQIKAVISPPDRQRSGSFYNTGNYLTWTGEKFVRQWLNGSIHAHLE